MTDKTLHILSSPGFLFGLSLLLWNDFILKEQFHNGFTGKLSDFAGLFVFSLFWIAFFPRRKTFICVATALLFVFWKSAYSQSLIEGWNGLSLFGISRTVDYTDLSALLVIPLSYFYRDVPIDLQLPRRLIHVIALISVVAFTATSYHHQYSFKNEYQFQSSKKQLLERMSQLPTGEVRDNFWQGESFEINFDSCNSRANFSVEERGDQSVINLKQMVHRCPSKPYDDTMREYFEKEFIDKLREEPVRQSATIQSIWATPPPSASTTPTPSPK